eukprot:TRINITY_DN5795_c0_g1_i4.p1 TRINITY_DN5795_c0_g1~~TRINITY_DN5795_c0_g1_i4.p1  ORF type:complete len:390 (+),score=143.32 TRINITY_DN5795_c0_g1_i4:41-1171(+)
MGNHTIKGYIAPGRLESPIATRGSPNQARIRSVERSSPESFTRTTFMRTWKSPEPSKEVTSRMAKLKNIDSMNSLRPKTAKAAVGSSTDNGKGALSKVAAVKQKHAEVEAKYKQEIQVLQSLVENMNRELSAKGIGAAEADVVARLQLEKDKERKILEELAFSQAKCAHLAQEYRDEEKRLLQAEKELDELRRWQPPAPVDDPNEKKERMKRENAALAERIEYLRNLGRTRNEQEAEIATLAEEQRRLEAEMASLTEENEKIREQNEALRTQMKTMEEELEHMELNEGGRVRQQVFDLEKQNKLLLADNQKLREQIAVIVGKLDHANQEDEKGQHFLSTDNDQLEYLNTTIAQLRGSIDILLQENDLLNRRLNGEA